MKKYNFGLTLFSALCLVIIFLFPFSYVEANFINSNIGINKKSSQTIVNQNSEFVESFNELLYDRYNINQADGANSYWNGTIENGFYKLQKTEYDLDIDQNQTIQSSGYDLYLKCYQFLNASNEVCIKENLNGSIIGGAQGFLTGWNERKEITITGSASGDQTNYLMDFYLNYTSGTDFNRTIFLENTGNVDFSDIRFTSDDGVSLLSSFVFGISNSSRANAIVEVPSILRDNNETVIYIYWDNSGASDVSDSSILDFYEPWDNSSRLTDTSIWQYGVGGDSTLNITSINGDNKLLITHPSTSTTNNAYFQSSYSGYPFGIVNTSAKLFVEEKLYSNKTDSSFHTKYFMDSRLDALTGAHYQITNTGSAACTAGDIEPLCYRDNTGSDFDDFSPEFNLSSNSFFNIVDVGNMSFWDMYISYSSDSTYQTAYFTWNGTRYDANGDRVVGASEAGSYIEAIYIRRQGYISGYGRNNIYTTFDDIVLIFTAEDEPTVSTTSSPAESSISYIGYLNNSDTYIGGINRFFPGGNITILPTLESTSGLTVHSFNYFNFRTYINTLNMTNTSFIQVYLYNLTETELLNQTGYDAMSTTDLEVFWNITSQPLYSKTFNLPNKTSGEYYDFNLTDLGNYWLDNRSSQTLIGFGVQLYDLDQDTGKNITAQPNNNFVEMSVSFVFDLSFNVELSDIASHEISTQIEPKNELLYSFAFTYLQSTNTEFTNENRYEFELAIETNSGSTLTRTNYFRAIINDPEKTVDLEWSTSTGDSSYSTGIILESLKSYRFSFELSKSDGRLIFSILNSTGNQLLRPTAWQYYVSNDITERPSIFSAIPLKENWFSNSTISYPRRGFALTVRGESSAVVSGVTAIYLDQLYASSGLIDEGFYCDVINNDVPRGCFFGSHGDFDDVGDYTAHWNNLSLSNTRVTYQRTIRDFRHFTGIMFLNSSDPFDNDQYVDFIRVYMQIQPIDKDGEESSDYMTAWINLNNNTGSYSLQGIASDNISLLMVFPNLPAGKAEVNFAFGVYWVDESTLGLSIKYYNVDISTTQPQTFSTYANYDVDLISHDVIVRVQYEIQYGNNYNTVGGSLGIQEPEFRFGSTLNFEVPSIPNPDVPYKPPTVLDNIFNGLAGFTSTLLSGDIFGAFGGIWDSLLNGIGSIGGFFVSALFDFLIPWVQAGILLIWNWFVDVTNTGDYWDLLYSLFNLALLLPVLIWLFLVFLNFGFPFIYGLAGSPEQAPQRIIDGIQKTWMFDASFGLASAVVPRIPLILVTIILTFIFGAIHEIAVIETINPF